MNNIIKFPRSTLFEAWAKQKHKPMTYEEILQKTEEAMRGPQLTHEQEIQIRKDNHKFAVKLAAKWLGIELKGEK